jgi:hypothetical protein
MSTESREELAKVISTQLDSTPGFIAWTDSAPAELAVALEPFIAKQCRAAKREGLTEGDTGPESRTITTIGELDELTEGSVVKDCDGDIFVCRTASDEAPGVFWDQVGETWPMDSANLTLPVTVLHEEPAV